ncbi:Bifunctional epoxide hydrolase 2 [Gryganskiella cystojenkinii]|nr:Bifunctional epoxide hydrolase 2 [Gryganskiella cystojenkinii]
MLAYIIRQFLQQVYFGKSLYRGLLLVFCRWWTNSSSPQVVFYNQLSDIKGRNLQNSKPNLDMIAVHKFVNSFNHQYATVNGHKYHYVDEGDAKNETLVLVHGFPDFWFGWRNQILFLVNQGYRVIAVDCMGYGETEQPRCVGNDVRPYTNKSIATDLVKLLDHLNVPKAVFIGHDWGSGHAWSAGRWFPERCNAIISIGNPDFLPRSTFVSTSLLILLNPAMFYFTIFESSEVEQWFDGDARTLAETSFDYLYPNTDEAITEEQREYYISTFTKTSFHGGYNYYRGRRMNFEDELCLVGKKYSVPSLMIQIEDDPILTPTFNKMVMAGTEHMYSDLKLESIDKGGHFIMTTNPDAVNEKLATYLHKVFSSSCKEE